MATLGVLADALAGRPLPVAVGDAVEFDPFSPGGGRLHPAAVGMDIRRDGDTAVVASVRVDPMFQGPPGRVHGGILAVLIDELMGTVNRMIGQRAYTARLAIDYPRPLRSMSSSRSAPGSPTARAARSPCGSTGAPPAASSSRPRGCS